jgi:uncharacterized membrane protein
MGDSFMLRKWFKAAAVAFSAAAISTLAMAGSANAGAYSAVRLTVCNSTSQQQWVKVSGQNQDGYTVTTWWTQGVPQNTCQLIKDPNGATWWWRVGQNITVNHNSQLSYFYIPYVSDGGGQTATLR